MAGVDKLPAVEQYTLEQCLDTLEMLYFKAKMQEESEKHEQDNG